ncbi:MAG: phospholipase A [Desulfurivibrionaceae bacterium]|nr:phospholipase A [Desulfurivibrionaceae bacterium]
MKLFRFTTVMLLFFWGLFFLAGGDVRAQDADAVSAESLDFGDLFTLYQPYLGNISAYEPLFFLVGTEPEKSTFQISFRYELFNPEGPLVTSHPWVKGFNFGYTQTSFWDLKSKSATFEDTSYKPELFHLSANLPARPSWLQGLFLQSGLHHESNGQGGEESRRADILYLKPLLIFYSGESQLGLQIAPKVWIYIDESGNNGNIADYRGYFEVEAKAGKAEGLVASTALRWAKEGGSVRVDLSWPVHHYLYDNLSFFIQMQYVNTLAESILDYHERTEAFRLGISFVR